ncbi:MAG: hypothetical protein WBN92_20255 [Terriglobia bacterium]
MFDEVDFVGAGTSDTPQLRCKILSAAEFRRSRTQEGGSFCQESQRIGIYGYASATNIAKGFFSNTKTPFPGDKC